MSLKPLKRKRIDRGEGPETAESGTVLATRTCARADQIEDGAETEGREQAPSPVPFAVLTRAYRDLLPFLPPSALGPGLCTPQELEDRRALYLTLERVLGEVYVLGQGDAAVHLADVRRALASRRAVARGLALAFTPSSSRSRSRLS